MDMNRVTLIWRISSDIKSNEINDWKTVVTNFNLATNRTFKNSAWEMIDEAEFTKCVAYWKLAEIIANNIEKWKKVYVEWRLKTRQYEDKEWVKRYVTEVVLSNVIFC